MPCRPWSIYNTGVESTRFQSKFRPDLHHCIMSNLEELISRESLKTLAGNTTFNRGEDYFSGRAVSRLLDDGHKLTARVAGTEIYLVLLWDKNGDLGYHCTCPHAAEGYFCKHCVAAGLAWIEQNQEQLAPGSTPTKQKHDPWQQIREYLSVQQPETLIELLLEVAVRDDVLYRSLLLNAECKADPINADNAFRKAIDDATHIPDFLDWEETHSFAFGLGQVIDSLEEMLAPERAATLTELSEYAIVRIEQTLEQVDDSEGEVGDVLLRLSDLHLEACELAKPEPIALAERLFRYETTLPFGSFSGSANIYRNVLGDSGWQHFRNMAEAAWSQIKPLEADPNRDTTVETGRWRITHIMKTFAEMSGDIEELVAIKCRDLSRSHHFMEIAEIYQKAGQQDKAIDWAKRGLKAFPLRVDNQLRDFLLGIYLDCGRTDEALQLTWIQFEEYPSLKHYKKLSAIAHKLNIWPQQRQRALEQIDADIARRVKTTSRWNPKPSTPDQSLRVEVALWENDLDAAWDALHRGTCGQNLLISLAGKLEETRAADALTLYRKVIPEIVGRTNNAAYDEAIRLIRKASKLMQGLGRDDALEVYLAGLRAQHKQKRNFIKLLDVVIKEI